MKERGKGREDAYGKRGSSRNGPVSHPVGSPIRCLGQTGNSENHNQVSQPTFAHPQRSLLHAGVNTCGERDIGDFNQNDS